MFKEELKLFKQGYRKIAGLDEAGRGPLAGPVVAAAVAIDRRTLLQRRSVLSNIRDSKKLSPKKREEWYKILINHSDIKWATGRVSEKVIDTINILEATKLAMKKAIEKLDVKPEFILLDGNFRLDARTCLPRRKTKFFLRGSGTKKSRLKSGTPWLVNQKAIVKADEKVFSCTAASIIAKVTRDKIMVKYAKKYPEYGFERHKGYATEYHRKMLKKYGPCKIHRRSFRPVKFN